jgi:hypothetical protein
VNVLGQFRARTEARLAAAAGGDALHWLRRAAAWGAEGLRDTLALAAEQPPASPAQAAAWLEAAQATAALPLVRAAQVEMARAALAAGHTATARAATEQAVALAAAINPWLDDTVRRWVQTAALFDALGDPTAAAAERQAGARWVQRGAAALPEGSAERQAWLAGSRWHRLLIEAGAPAPDAATAPVRTSGTRARRRA